MADKAKREKMRLSGGWWRRTFAMCADFILILSLYQAVGIYLYDRTDTHWRMLWAPITFSWCDTKDGLVGKNEGHYGVRPDTTTRCTYSYFGFEFNRMKKLTEVLKNETKDGVTSTSTRWEQYYVDRHDNRVDDVLIIDGLKGITLIAALALFESLFGASPGKALLGLKVVRAFGKRPNFGQALKRNVLIWGSWALGGLLSLLAQLGIEAHVNLTINGLDYLSIAWLVFTIVWYLAPILAFLFARPHPFYDNWSGTMVVPRKAPKALAPAGDLLPD